MWNIYSILGSVSTQRFGAEKSWPLLLQSRAEPHANPCCTQSNQVEAQRFVETGTIWGFLCLIYICNTRLNGGLGLLQFVPLSYKIIIIIVIFLLLLLFMRKQDNCTDKIISFVSTVFLVVRCHLRCNGFMLSLLKTLPHSTHRGPGSSSVLLQLNPNLTQQTSSFGRLQLVGPVGTSGMLLWPLSSTSRLLFFQRDPVWSHDYISF